MLYPSRQSTSWMKSLIVLGFHDMVTLLENSLARKALDEANIPCRQPSGGQKLSRRKQIRPETDKKMSRKSLI